MANSPQEKIETGAQLAEELEPQQRQDILNTAADIQKLLQQVERNYPTEMLKQPEAVTPYLISQIEANSTLKYRLANALRIMTIPAFLDIVESPFTNVLNLALKSWERPKE